MARSDRILRPLLITFLENSAVSYRVSRRRVDSGIGSRKVCVFVVQRAISVECEHAELAISCRLIYEVLIVFAPRVSLLLTFEADTFFM